MSKYREITFTAVAQKDFSGYLIHFRSTMFAYLPLERMVRLENHCVSLTTLQTLTEAELLDLGFAPYDVAHLIAFCKRLCIIPASYTFYPVAALIIKAPVKLKIPSPPNNSLNSLPEVKLKLHWSKTAKLPPENVSVSMSQVTFTPAEVIVTYQKGRNIFQIGFSYLKNGLLQYYKVKLERISQIPALETRQLKAENLCNVMTQHLIQGWTAEKVIQVAHDYDAFY